MRVLETLVETAIVAPSNCIIYYTLRSYTELPFWLTMALCAIFCIMFYNILDISFKMGDD